jgi:hypothetical protein
LEIDVTAWNEKVDKFKLKVKKAAAKNDPIAQRNNEQEAKRLEVELEKLKERNSALEAEREGKLYKSTSDLTVMAKVLVVSHC